MSYIGPEPYEAFTSYATETFSVSATTSYTLSYSVANENELALFVNNVRQQPGSGKAYTASGTALTLSAATASTDTMYAIYLGRALQTSVPATNSITDSMLASAPTADQWRLNSTYTVTGSSAVLTNLEQVDSDGFGGLGTAMSVSSGIFTFPMTGVWLITANAYLVRTASGSANVTLQLQTTTDNSTYNGAAISAALIENVASYEAALALSFMFDVTSTSNCKCKFEASSNSANIVNMYAESAQNTTNFTFLRLGDT